MWRTTDKLLFLSQWLIKTGLGIITWKVGRLKGRNKENKIVDDTLRKVLNFLNYTIAMKGLYNKERMLKNLSDWLWLWFSIFKCAETLDI